MGLLVQFPNKYSRTWFIIAIALIYIAFCIPDNGKYQIKIDYLEAIANYCLIGLLAFVGCVEIKNRLVKSIFFAVIWDTIFSLANFFIFGFEFNQTSNIIRNISFLVAIFYAFFILFGERKK